MLHVADSEGLPADVRSWPTLGLFCLVRQHKQQYVVLIRVSVRPVCISILFTFGWPCRWRVDFAAAAHGGESTCNTEGVLSLCLTRINSVTSLKVDRKREFQFRPKPKVHAERLPWTICLSTLVLIAQAVFLLQRGRTDIHTDTQTRLITIPTPTAIAGLGNDKTAYIL